MTKNKKNPDSENKDVTINLKESSLAEFVKRPVPGENEVRELEDIIEKEPKTNGFDDEINEKIEESLNEIYQDDKGNMVDVKKMDVKKRHGFLFGFFSFILVFGIIGAASYYGYDLFHKNRSADASVVDFSLEGKDAVAVGEEFFYTVNFKNNGGVRLTDVNIELSFPEHFQVLETYPESIEENKYLWQIEYLPQYSGDNIKIKGFMAGEKDETGIIQASMRYQPENFSSEFKKEATLVTQINDIGLDFDFDYVKNVLVGEVEEITLHFDARTNNYISDFRLTLEPKENLEILSLNNSEERTGLADFEQERPGVWRIKSIGQEEVVLPIKIKFIEKNTDKESLDFIFEFKSAESDYIVFKRESLDFELMKSDLNLAVIINGSREDKGIDFGEKLNYSIVYKNKGETEMRDVVIMAVLESDFLDWTTLAFDNPGQEKGNTITWTKEELPALEAIEQNGEGVIDFSISLLKAAPADEKKDYQVKSYARFSVGNIDEDESPEDGSDNLSNTIINKINSDLDIVEKIKYFNDDNIPVGTGPHPPRVGETTTYKVYWEISNNLHELKDLIVRVALPDYVSWDDKNRSTVGNIIFDEQSREVRWEIGRLPVTVFSANGEFSISVTPEESDANKIMMLIPGSNISAIDSETEAELNKTTKAKTTRLEDDEIAEGDGIVR